MGEGPLILRPWLPGQRASRRGFQAKGGHFRRIGIIILREMDKE